MRDDGVGRLHPDVEGCALKTIVFETLGWPGIGTKVLLPSGKIGRVKSYNLNDNRVVVEYLDGVFTEAEIREGSNTVCLKPSLMVKLDE